jgi:hypothetical protein
MINFADVATKSISEIERPPLPPVGTYRWKISKVPEQTSSNDGNWDIVNFSVRALEALDDVDLEDYKGEVGNIIQSVRFMFNKNDESEFEKSLFRLRTFLEKHVQCAEAGMTIPQAMNASVGQEFLGTIVWRQDKQDTETFHANIGRTAPLE